MTALPQQKTEALNARLGAATLPTGGAWIQAAREAASARLATMGLPVRRDEYWRYTDPTSLTAPAATEVALMAEGQDPATFAGVDSLRITFVDGVFDAARSDALAQEGIEICRLADAAAADAHWAAGVYGVLEARGQKPVDRPLAALNTALAADGVLIRVTGAVARPVLIDHVQTSTTSDAMLHHVVSLEAGAKFTLLESGVAAARFNSVLEVEVADGASFNHVRTQGTDSERRVATHIFTRLGAESHFKSFTLNENGGYSRNEAIIELTGDDASAHVGGATIGNGRAMLGDDTVFITHDAERCESRQVYKKVLRNAATGVFQGKILVKPGAQKTDGYQISQSLLLDEDANFLAKPELEIYADDVKCSHGSTSGAIDETALYYLRSRGVPRRKAESLLVLSFLAEAVAEIADETLAELIGERLEAYLDQHQG